jgi:hypothetical protein
LEGSGALDTPWSKILFLIGDQPNWSAKKLAKSFSTFDDSSTESTISLFSRTNGVLKFKALSTSGRGC